MEIRAGTLVECVGKYCIEPIGTVGIVVRKHKECEHTYLVNWYKDMIKALKGVSVRLLMKEYGDTLRRRLWGVAFMEPILFYSHSLRKYGGTNN